MHQGTFRHDVEVWNDLTTSLELRMFITFTSVSDQGREMLNTNYDDVSYFLEIAI